MLQRSGRKERIIVLGTGWGAAALMGRLDPLRYEIVCVSPRNYFLMTPLLPSVTVGEYQLSASDLSRSRLLRSPSRFTRFFSFIPVSSFTHSPWYLYLRERVKGR
jgi:NADH dehydrogenase FAD-containing subunit